MKGLDGLIRLNRWKLAEERRRLDELEGLADGIRDQRAALEAEVADEGEAARVDAEAARAFSVFLEGAMGRRQSLEDSLEELEQQIVTAHDEVSRAFAELKRLEIAAEEQRAKAMKKAKRREQATADEIGIESHRRARGVS